MSTLAQDPAPPDSPDSPEDWASVPLRDNLATSSAPALLLTILGELVLPLQAPVWTSALLYLLKGLGIEAQTARQTIARTADAGLIVGEKSGRVVRWSITDAGKEMIEETTRRVRSLNTATQCWDGLCLILVVSVPQEQKAVRKRLYNALSWAGFGNPAPGVWASPHVDREDEMRQIIKDFDLQGSSFAFTGRTLKTGLTDAEIVDRAWDLDDVAKRYENLIATFSGIHPSPGDELLFTYVALANEWRQFPSMDPQLPHDLLPDWVGRRAMEMFVDRYTNWSDGAFRRWREILDLTATDR